MNLTKLQKTELRRRIEVETHYLEGGKIERELAHTGWIEVAPIFSFNWEEMDYRIKPEKKLRLRTCQEVPYVFCYHRKGSNCMEYSHTRLLYSANEEWMDCEFTSDGITWHSFMVEE